MNLTLIYSVQRNMSLPVRSTSLQPAPFMREAVPRLHDRMPCPPSCSGRQDPAWPRYQAAPSSVELVTAPVSGKSFIRPHLLSMEPYTPILPFEILSKQMGMDPHDIVKLDANENPYGPPPEVREALGNMQFPNIYPDPETRQLRAALSELNDIPMENLLVSAMGWSPSQLMLAPCSLVLLHEAQEYAAGWLRGG